MLESPLITVHCANGTIAKSTKSGHIPWAHLPPETKLAHVLPGFPNSLVSMGILCDTGHHCLFTDKIVIAYDKNTKKVKLQGWRERKPGDMWRFPLINLSENSP